MEIEILNYINNYLHGSNIINHLIKFISMLSDMGLIWIFIGILLLFFKKTRLAGLLTLCGVISTLFINSLILKNLFDRTRPFIENNNLATFIESLQMSLPQDSSFPSGHTFVAFCCSILLCLQLKGKWFLIYIFSTLTALSRIFLCVHYPTDVLAGAVFGTIVGLGIHFFVKAINKKISTNKKNNI